MITVIGIIRIFYFLLYIFILYAISIWNVIFERKFNLFSGISAMYFFSLAILSDGKIFILRGPEKNMEIYDAKNAVILLTYNARCWNVVSYYLDYQK